MSDAQDRHRRAELALPLDGHRRDDLGTVRHYVRIVTLGDSATYGLGDRVEEGWRGWARILTDAIGQQHDVSFCNLAVPGATSADVRRKQLDDAVAHRPHVASLIVGLNDVFRASWDPARIRADLLLCAERLTGVGAVLVLPRFHDHSRVFPLPRLVRERMGVRVEALNAIYDELHETYGGLRVEFDRCPDVYRRELWSIDRLHPSELGHRFLAATVAEQLNRAGLSFPLPDRTSGARRTSARDVWELVTTGGPWIGRRARDFAPWATRIAVAAAYARVVAALAD